MISRGIAARVSASSGTSARTKVEPAGWRKGSSESCRRAEEARAGCCPFAPPRHPRRLRSGLPTGRNGPYSMKPTDSRYVLDSPAAYRLVTRTCSTWPAFTLTDTDSLDRLP